MKKIVECVPNFSEGRNTETIEAIADAIRRTNGCTLLDVDPGHSTNRTVYTFVGDPDAVINGALNAAQVARKKIDMRYHSGEHPRMGAMDVCPFIPVSGVTMDECVEISKTFAKLASEKLSVPFYLYEASTASEYRKRLPQIREGEYEGLEKKLKETAWQPDYGPAEFNPKWGATVTGARAFLIAYNINLLATPNQAHRIALNLREAGRGPDAPGQFKAVKGMGWFVDEYNLAQVTVNLTDYQITPPHMLFEAVKMEAAKLNIAVAGSEIVGLVPLDALLKAAEYYIEKERLFILDEDQKIRLAVERLGLNAISQFRPEEKIIEYRVMTPPDAPLTGLPLGDFIASLGARTTAPGGGSAAAAIAAVGAALGSMVGKLTYGVRKFEHADMRMRTHIPPLHQAYQELIPMIDADTNAYNDYIAAIRLPQSNEMEKKYRFDKMQEGLKAAINIPLTTMRIGDRTWDSLLVVATHGNPAMASDAAVGARALETGIWGAYRNVLINMTDIEDKKYKKQILQEAEALKKRAEEMCAAILGILDTTIKQT